MTYRFAILLLLLFPFLQSCNGNFGFSKTVPDEFRVVSHPPLVIPEDFSLPKPVRHSSRRSFQSGHNEASSFSQQELYFIGLFGSSTPGIRNIMNNEYNNYKSSVRTKVTNTLGIGSLNASPFSTKLDPIVEKKRLKEIKALN